MFSQEYLNYYKKVNLAEINALEGRFLKSDSTYQEAFSLVKKPFKEDLYLAAINSEKINNDKKTYQYLKLAIENGLKFNRIRNEEFKKFKNSTFWKKLKTERKQLEKIFLSRINISLRDEIHEMIKKDQKARRPIFGSWKQMKKIDSLNFQKLLEIIKENNDTWPGFSLIGENTPKGKYNVTGNIALMLLHFKKEEINILKPYIFKAVLSGEMYPYHYARIIDYTIGIPSRSCQIYGTYLDGGVLIKICDCNEAEENRSKIGLEPIVEYYKKNNSKYKCLK